MSLDNLNMNRRQVLQRVAYLMGGAVSAPAVLGLLNGCSPKQEASTWQPVFFSKEQGAIVAEVADIIIPRTRRPARRMSVCPGSSTPCSRMFTSRQIAIGTWPAQGIRRCRPQGARQAVRRAEQGSADRAGEEVQ